MPTVNLEVPVSSRISQATRLFDHLAADLSSLRAECQDEVLCPLCAAQFGRAALLEKGNDGLSVEHIIPKALHGQYVTLTCRRCNNRQGSALDANLIRMIRTLDWAEGDGSVLRGTVRVGDVELPMKVAWNTAGKPRTIEILGGKPERLQEFVNTARKMGEGDRIGLNISLGYIEVRARQALVRLGYLVLFDKFGYRYILSGAGTWTRHLLTNGDIDALRGLTPRLGDVEERRIKKPIIVSPVVDEDVVLAHLILLRTDTLKRRYHGVLLPAATIPEDRAFNVISEIARKLHGNQLTIRVSE